MAQLPTRAASIFLVRSHFMRPASILVAIAVLAAAYAWYVRSDYHHRGNRLFYRNGRPNRLGRVVARLSSELAGLGMPPSFLVSLETRGSRTGRRRAIPVVLADYGGERFVVSMLGERSPWVQNIRAAGGWAVIRHGHRCKVHLAELPPDARAPVLRAYLARASDARPHFPVDWDAPVQAFERIAPAYPVFRIEVAEPRNGPS
jgi:deazaflavin-dependent oxidoreductase (nitroreductase family)